MNIEALTAWFSQTKVVDRGGEYDGSSNWNGWEVREHEGKFYRVEFCNKHPCEKWTDKGWERGVYEPREVQRKTRTITEVYYE